MTLEEFFEARLAERLDADEEELLAPDSHSTLEEFFKARLAESLDVDEEELTPEYLSEVERKTEHDLRPIEGVLIGGYVTPGHFRRFLTWREIEERRARVVDS